MLLALISILTLLLPATTTAAAPDRPTLTTPAGTYRTAWIDLAGPGGGRVFVAWRDNTPAQFWATKVDLAFPPAKKLEGSPKLLVDAIRGNTQADALHAEFDLRLVSIWAPQRRLATTTLVLDLRSAAGKLQGTWKAGNLGGEARGEFTSPDPIAPNAAWPSYFGDGSALRAPPYNKPLVDDLALARPLWRSEAATLSGWGTGVDSRYKGRAAHGTLNGGSSSPIVADGRLFLFHYRPAGDGEPDAALLATFDLPVEKQSVRLFFSKRADVVVTCLDAATGATLWESVWPARQPNIQTHKWRGFNHTPTVAHGVVVVSDYSMGLHALDAKTGELKWTRGGGGTTPGGSVGPVVCGQVVVWATPASTVGLDLQTGRELWKSAGANTARQMVIAGHDRALLVDRTLRLLDPATGREIARTDFPGGWENKGRKEIGRGIGANLVCDGNTIVSFITTKEADKSVGSLFALRVTDDKIQPAWTHEAKLPMEDGHIGITIADGKVFTAFQTGGAFAIDLATGKTLATLPDMNAHSNPIFVTADNRILWQPECQHGRQQIQLIDAKSFQPLGSNWRPPHNDTTAYGEMPIANVLVDGRLYLRGMDGIYCYDLRGKE